jgi:hypothetical protein
MNQLNICSNIIRHIPNGFSANSNVWRQIPGPVLLYLRTFISLLQQGVKTQLERSVVGRLRPPEYTG